jgi:hypothetical protein
MKELQDIRNIAPKAPPPSESDPSLASFAALQQACLRALGFTYLEEELRQQYRGHQKEELERNATFRVAPRC